MTEFDPKFALEVMERRQSEANKQAAEIHLEKFILQMEGRIPMWGGAAHEMDKRIHALWAKADSYDSVIEYLEERIWESKTLQEKIWGTVEGWGFGSSGPELVADVLEARDMVLDGYRQL